MDKATEAMRGEQIGNMMKSFNLPDVDISDMIETQRRQRRSRSPPMLRDLKLSSEQRRDIATKAFDNASARGRELAEMTAVQPRGL